MADYGYVYDYGYDKDYLHKKYGYGRERFFGVQLPSGFVQYERHVFICHGSSRDWPGDFVRDDPDSLPAKLVCAVKSHENEIKTKTIVRVCEASYPAGLEEGDVFIFPDMLKCSLRSSDVDSFVSDVLVNGAQCEMDKLTKGSFVFVCAHAKSDLRNGVCGELVMKKCNEVVTENNLEKVLFPIRCSDLGLPQNAANIIIYSRTKENTIDGHWYSNLSPCCLIYILLTHFVRGVVEISNWRGKMGNKTPKEIWQYPEWFWYRGPAESVKLAHFHGEMMSWSGLIEVKKQQVRKDQLNPVRLVDQLRYMQLLENVDASLRKGKGKPKQTYLQGVQGEDVDASFNMERKEEKEEKKEKKEKEKEPEPEKIQAVVSWAV